MPPKPIPTPSAVKPATIAAKDSLPMNPVFTSTPLIETASAGVEKKGVKRKNSTGSSDVKPGKDSAKRVKNAVKNISSTENTVKSNVSMKIDLIEKDDRSSSVGFAKSSTKMKASKSMKSIPQNLSTANIKLPISTVNSPIKFVNKNSGSSFKTSPTIGASTKTSKPGPSNSKSAASSGSAHISPLMVPIQIKLKKSEIAKRDLKEMDALERAFREDTQIWCGPERVVFPRQYHSKQALTSESNGGSDQSVSKNNHDLPHHGSLSRSWMYRKAYAGIGGRSWMDAMSAPSIEFDAFRQSRDKNGEGERQHLVDSCKPHTLQELTAPSNDMQKEFLLDDITIVENALKSNGLSRSNVTPKAYACFLEQARRYALELLVDAQDYATHANRSTLPMLLPTDLLLAAELREDVNGVQSLLPSYEEMIDFAIEVNRAPIPPIPQNCYNGVALPPVEQQVTARTFDVVNSTRVSQRVIKGGDTSLTVEEFGKLKKHDTDVVNVNGNKGETKGTSLTQGLKTKGDKSHGSYGAGRGRQIVVHMKTHKSSLEGGIEATGALNSSLIKTKSSQSVPSMPVGSMRLKRKLTEL